MTLLNLHRPMAPVSSMSRSVKRRDGGEGPYVRGDLDPHLAPGPVAQRAPHLLVRSLQRLQRGFRQDAVALLVEVELKVIALVTLEVPGDVVGLLQQQPERLALFVLGVDGQRFLHGFEGARIRALEVAQKRGQIQRIRRFRLRFHEPLDDRPGILHPPCSQELSRRLEAGITGRRIRGACGGRHAEAKERREPKDRAGVSEECWKSRHGSTWEHTVVRAGRPRSLPRATTATIL